MKQTIKAIQDDLKNILLLFLAIGVWYVTMHLVFHAFCIHLIIFGIPCAGCGMTRALLAVLQGQFMRAFYLNPSIFIWICYLVYVGYKRYVKLTMKNTLRVLIGVFMVSFFIYVYRMYTQFPGYPPMSYYDDCMLGNIFPGYMDWIKSIFA